MNATKYYEEKMINGILHVRHGLKEKFRPITLEELSKKYMEIKKKELDKLMAIGRINPYDLYHLHTAQS